MTSRVVVAGASLAGLSAVRGLRSGGFEGEIVLIGEENRPPYTRPPLSKEVLAGARPPESTALRIQPDLEFELRLGRRVESADVTGRRVVLDGGESVGWDGLVVATGARVRRIPGFDRPGVHYLRTVEDCLAIGRAFGDQPRVVVVGAGFIGSEVASTARSLGLDVTVLEMAAVPLERALGVTMGRFCADLHRDGGTNLRLGAAVDGLVGDGRVEGVRLAGGEVVPADVVVVGVGVAPATDWLEGSGLQLSDGVMCDSGCFALGGDGAVVAAGDVARWEHPLFGEPMRFEHWDNAVAQGEAAGANLAAGREGARPFDHIPYFWSDQYGTKLQFVGASRPGDELTFVEGSPEERRFVAAYVREGRTVGALLVNRPARMPAFRDLIARGAAPPTGE